MGPFHRAWPLRVGVHQGSVWSDIYIILILKSSKLLHFELLADDTNITERHHYKNEPTKMMVRHKQLVIKSDHLGIGH